MRVVYLGNHDIGVACLNELVNQNEDVVAVLVLSKGYWEKISKVEREHVWYESVEDAARRHGLPVYRLDDINEPEYVYLIRELRSDVLFSISWDLMLKRPILDIPGYGCFDIHYAFSRRIGGTRRSIGLSSMDTPKRV